MSAVGPVVRLDLERRDTGGTVEAELSRERYVEESFKPGDEVFVRPRKLRLFLAEEDYSI